MDIHEQAIRALAGNIWYGNNHVYYEVSDVFTSACGRERYNLGDLNFRNVVKDSKVNDCRECSEMFSWIH